MTSSRDTIDGIMQTALLHSHGISNRHNYGTGYDCAMRLCKHTRQRRDILQKQRHYARASFKQMRDIMRRTTSTASAGAITLSIAAALCKRKTLYGQQDINSARKDFMPKQISTQPSRALYVPSRSMPRPNASSRTGKPLLQHSHGRYASHLCAGRKQNSMHRRSVRETTQMPMYESWREHTTSASVNFPACTPHSMGTSIAVCTGPK